MTRADVEEVLERHRQSFASRDATRLAADHAEDGTFESPAAGLVRSRAAIEGVYRYWLDAFPDMEFTWRAPVIDGHRAALFWHFRGTVAGDYFGQAQRGTRVEFIGAAEYEFTPAGEIASARHVFDFTGSLVSSGALRVKPV